MNAGAHFDVVVAGGGIVGAACAASCARQGLNVALVERDVPGSGATAAGMGHVVVMDDSEAQFALTRYSQKLWQKLVPQLPTSAEYERRGTLWIAADAEEMEAAERKFTWYSERQVPCRLLTADQLGREEPNLAPGFAGGLLVLEDGVVYPPAVALALALNAQERGATLFIGRSIARLGHGSVMLDDGSELQSARIVLAMGADSIELRPDLPVRKRKGHLVITDRYPGFVHHQLVELGYLKSAHTVSADSVAFNVQPRQTGQLLIGSSRQYGAEHTEVDQPILSSMLARAETYMPRIARLSAIRVWTGFRAATPDKLPLIGPDCNDASLLLATGHEGLGITTSLATAELIADIMADRRSAIALEPYLPARFAHMNANEDKEEKHEMERSHAGVDDGI